MRIENQNLCESLRGKPCVVCGRRSSTVAHHWKTKGSGGPDMDWNLMVLCDYHHQETHKIGATTFARKYQQVSNWLFSHDWRKDEFMNKWIHIGNKGWDDNMENE